MSSIAMTVTSLSDLLDISLEKNIRPAREHLRQQALTLTRALLSLSSFLSEEDAQQVTIHRAPSGQPSLRFMDANALTLPQISISHSRHWVGILLSSFLDPCAMDIEDMSVPRSYMKITQWAFSKKETHFVEKNGVYAFYALWTAKEAFAKSQGRGLPTALKTLWDPYLENFKSPGAFKVQIHNHTYLLTQEIIRNTLFCTTIQQTTQSTLSSPIFINMNTLST